MVTGEEAKAPPEGGQGGVVEKAPAGKRITIRGRERLEAQLARLIPALGYIPSWREVAQAPLVALDAEYLSMLKETLGVQRVGIATALKVAVAVAKEALKEERYRELAKGV